MMRRLAAFLRRVADLLEGRRTVAPRVAAVARSTVDDITLADHLMLARILERALQPWGPPPVGKA